MRIYVLRHGETDLNKKHVMQGWLDEPLNENGRALAARAGRALGGIRFDACYSSPLRRAAETAAIILRESGNTIPVTTDERLREICFGELDGTALPPETEVRFFSDPRSLDPFPGGEHVEDVCRRTQAFLHDLIRKDGVFLVSTHGCALRAMLNPLYADPSDFWQGRVPPNCAVTVIGRENGAPVILENDRILPIE